MIWFGRAAELVGDNSAPAILVLAAAVLLLSLIMLVVCLRVRRLGRRRSLDLAEESAERLAQTIGTCVRDIEDLKSRVEALSVELGRLSRQQLLCVQKVGFVRFDAFEDVGGEQSFAVALLDADNNGLVLNNIYSRSESRVYAKRLSAGNASHTLSNEEQEAVRQAMRT